MKRILLTFVLVVGVLNFINVPTTKINNLSLNNENNFIVKNIDTLDIVFRGDKENLLKSEYSSYEVVEIASCNDVVNTICIFIERK